jgi:hypothetical protein
MKIEFELQTLQSKVRKRLYRTTVIGLNDTKYRNIVNKSYE